MTIERYNQIFDEFKQSSDRTVEIVKGLAELADVGLIKYPVAKLLDMLIYENVCMGAAAAAMVDNDDTLYETNKKIIRKDIIVSHLY